MKIIGHLHIYLKIISLLKIIKNGIRVNSRSIIELMSKYLPLIEINLFKYFNNLFNEQFFLIFKSIRICD